MKINSSRKDETIKKLVALLCILSGPTFAQSTEDTVVRFTGFLGDLRLTQEDVRAGLSGEDPEMRQIAIAMNEDATVNFARFTTTHVNQSVTFSVCGVPMQSIVVQVPIESGFALTDALPIEQAEALVAALNGLADCPE